MPGAEVQTVLVVEDEPSILDLTRRILERGGLEVLTARSAAEAQKLDAAFDRPIHLLLSDVIMPGTNGPALAQELKKHRPDMRVILMSGYPDGAMLVLNYGWHFIAKPFIAQALLSTVRDVLQGETREQQTDGFDTRIDIKHPA